MKGVLLVKNGVQNLCGPTFICSVVSHNASLLNLRELKASRTALAVYSVDRSGEHCLIIPLGSVNNSLNIPGDLYKTITTTAL